MGRHVILPTALALLASLALASPAAAAKPSPAPLTTIPVELVPVTTEVAQAPVEAVAPKAMAAKARGQGASNSQVAAIAASAGCWHGSFWAQQANLFGWVLFRYNEHHDWCGDGTWITYVSVYTWASNLMATVEYKGDTKTSVYGVGWNVWKEHMQGHFTGGATPWGPLVHYYPWIEVYVGGGGQTYYIHYGG